MVWIYQFNHQILFHLTTALTIHKKNSEVRLTMAYCNNNKSVISARIISKTGFKWEERVQANLMIIAAFELSLK